MAEQQGNSAGAASGDQKTDPKDDAKSSKTEKVVRYVGSSDVREIDAASFARVGAEGQNKVVWNQANNHTVKASELTKDALKYLDENAGFKVEDVEV